MNYDDLLARLRGQVSDQMSAHAGGDDPMSYDQRLALADHLIEQVLEAHATAELAAGRQPPSRTLEHRLSKDILAELFGLGSKLQELIDDPTVENVIINGYDRCWVRRAGRIRERVGPVAASDAELIATIRTAAARLGLGERRIDNGSPALSLKLPGGARLFAIMAVCGRPSVTIRIHRYVLVRLRELQRLQTVDWALCALLTALVLARFNILIVGGTDTGKTTLARALLHEVPADERIITVEDALELNIGADEDLHPDVVELQAREPNVEGEGAIDCAQLVRFALRMSPDRVVVGEVRGPEIVPMLNAMSQGNDGSISTIHASSTAIAFDRIRTYAIQAPERVPMEATNLLIAAAVDFVIHLGYDTGGNRVVTSVREVVGADGLQVVSNEIHRPDAENRAVPAAPVRTTTMKRLIDVGFDPTLLERKEGWWEA